MTEKSYGYKKEVQTGNPKNRKKQISIGHTIREFSNP